MAGEKLVCFDFDDTLVNTHFHGQLTQDKSVNASYGGVGIQMQQPDGSCHLYNEGQYQGTISKQGSGAPLSKINQLIGIGQGNPPPGLKNPHAIANAIKQAIDNGHKVAITSFTHYPEVAIPTLNAIMQTIMSPQDASRYVNQVCIVGGYPSNGITGLKKDAFSNYIPNPNFRGKEEHIAAAIWHFNQQPGVQLSRSDAMLVDDSKPNVDIAAKLGRVQKVPELPNPQSDYVAPIVTFVSTNLRRQNTPVQPPQTQQPTGPQFYQANQIAGQLAKLNQQSLTQWETRPGQSNNVSQFVSPPLSKAQAERLLSEINPSLKGVLYPTRDGSSHRVVINIQEAVKLGPNALFSKNAQIQAQNQNINPNVQTSSNVQTQFTAPPRSPLGQLPPMPKVAPQLLKDAVQFLRTGDYQSIPALKDLKFARGIENYSFDISQQNDAFFAHINSVYGNENKTIPLSAADIQKMANIARASMSTKATTPTTPVAASRPIPSPIPSAAPVSNRVGPAQGQPAAVAPVNGFIKEVFDAIQLRIANEAVNKRLPQLSAQLINGLNRINASVASPQQKEAQALHYLQAQAENNHYAWNALKTLGKPTSAPQVAPTQQPVAQPMPPVATNVAQPRTVSPNIGKLPPTFSPIQGPTPQPPDAAISGPTSRPLPQPHAQPPARAPVIYDSSLGLNSAMPAPMVFASQAATNNYVQFSQVTNQQRAANIPPVDQKLVQEANQIEALKAILDTPITTLKGQYESFSKAKHASENQGMLHSFAKSVAKSVSGIAKERNQQVNDISQALQAIKNAPNLNALDKATLAYAHLESVKAAMGSGKSGIKDLCDSLGKQIESAVPGAKNNYHSNAIGHIAQAENFVGKIKDPQQQPSHNKPR